MYEWFAGNDKFDRYDSGLVEAWPKKESTNVIKVDFLVFEKQLDSIRVDDVTFILIIRNSAKTCATISSLYTLSTRKPQ